MEPKAIPLLTLSGTSALLSFFLHFSSVAAPMPYDIRSQQEKSDKNKATSLTMTPPADILKCIKTGLADILKKNSIDALMDTPTASTAVFRFYGNDRDLPLENPDGMLTVLGTELFMATANCGCETPREMPGSEEYEISIHCQPWPEHSVNKINSSSDLQAAP
ncbi:hypothetical protein ACH42_05890 [Endozoicomonas sp. (ex Bugula neritina AB1)]|nr:hypothetical protein ACH42_05890 [Endozoicomonas sp. (ex Bugula neritina AB1)]